MAAIYSGDFAPTTGAAAGGFDIGITTTGSLTVDGGSTEVWGNGTTQNPFGRLGVDPGGVGTVLVTGDFSRLVLDGAGGETGMLVGSRGTGTLTITNGGAFVIDNAVTATGTDLSGISVGRFGGANGTFDVDGATATFTGYGSYLDVGRDGGAGIANFTDATVELVSANESFFNVGRGIGSTGTMNLTGTTMTLAAGGMPGAQTQFAGSTFTVGRDGATGTLNIDASSLVFDDLVDAADATDFFSTGGQIGRSGGTGVANLTNGADWSMTSANSDAFLRIGRDVGGSGSLNIDATSTFSMTGANGSGVQIGRDGGVGAMDVAGSATLDGGPNFASIVVGRSFGSGTLDVSGAVDIRGGSSAALVIGETGATGSLDLTGTIGIDASDTASLGVGLDGGTGSATVHDGGMVEVTSGSGARATVSVGRSGTGTLDLAADSSISIASDNGSRLAVGNGAGGNGTANISGTLDVTGNGVSAGINVGIFEASGTLNVLGGTTTVSGSSATMFVGADFGDGGTTANGSVSVASGATLALSGDTATLQFGNDGVGTGSIAGTLSIAATNRAFLDLGDAGSGTLDVTGTIDIDAGDDIGLNIGFDGGTGRLNASGATISISGDPFGGGFVGIDMSADFGGGAGTGSAFLENATTLTLAGANTFINVGQGDASTSRLEVLSGSTITSTGGLSVSGSAQNATARMVIDGAGSAVTLGDNVNVGYGLFNGAGTTDAELRITDGAALTANGLFVEQGGRVAAGAATIETTGFASSFNTGGGFTALAGGITTFRGGVDFAAGSEMTVEIASSSSAGRIVVDGGFGNFQPGSGLTFDATGTTFAGGETFVYASTSGGGTIFAGRQLADIAITGQTADFGFLLDEFANGNQRFTALTDSAGNGQAVLDFGSPSGSGASFSYDAAFDGGQGTGGTYFGNVFGFGLDVIAGTAANDTLTVSGNAAMTVFGRGGDDTIATGSADDVIEGGAGGDAMDGGAGTDRASYSGSSAGVTVDLAAGTASGGHADGDTLARIENLTGSAFADQLTGDGGVNDLVGGAGNDILRGDGGDDRLDGGEGADILFGGAGGDLIIGGAGLDFVSYTDATTGITLDLLDGSQNAGDAVGDTLVQIENLVGSNLADTILGGNVANTIFGRAGNDVIDGRGGADLLRGEGGADELIGGAGFDRLEGGAGNDTLRGGSQADELFGEAGADILFGGAGSDLLDGGAGFDFVSYTSSTSAIVLDILAPGANAGDAAGDVLVRIENLVGSNFSDTIRGGNVANQVLGRSGDDVIDARGGADLIDGGAGADTMTGGTGFDTFRYQLAGESTLSARDTITDFTSGQDAIDLAAIDAGAAPGNQALAFIGTAGFSGNGTGEVRYGTASGNTTVIVDTDGNGSADMAIFLTGVTSLAAGDFVL